MDSEFPPPKPQDHESEVMYRGEIDHPGPNLLFKNPAGEWAGGYFEYVEVLNWISFFGRQS